MRTHRRSSTTSSIMVRPSVSTKVRKEHKRSVSFNSMAEVCYLEVNSSSTSSTEDENIDPSELWWTTSDYKMNKRRCRSVAKRLCSGGRLSPCGVNDDIDETDCHCRGLERMMDGGESRAQIVQAVCAVQREQARHRLDGDVEDPDLILAEVYGAHCIASAVQAKRLGCMDAQEAKTALVSDWGSSLSSQTLEYDVSDDTKAVKKQKPSSGTTENCSRLFSDRVPFRDNLKFSLSNVMSRRRHAWL